MLRQHVRSEIGKTTSRVTRRIDRPLSKRLRPSHRTYVENHGESPHLSDLVARMGPGHSLRTTFLAKSSATLLHHARQNRRQHDKPHDGHCEWQQKQDPLQSARFTLNNAHWQPAMLLMR